MNKYPLILDKAPAAPPKNIPPKSVLEKHNFNIGVIYRNMGDFKGSCITTKPTPATHDYA